MQKLAGLAELGLAELGLAELCLQSACPMCQRSTPQVLCCDCQQRLQRLQLPDPEQGWQPPLPILAWGAYSGALKQAIAALKYEHQPQLAQPLGDGLAQVWLNSAMSKKKPLIVVPIPLHAAKQQQRGFNQAELLARAFCNRTGLPLQPQGLVRSRLTEAQFGLSATAREHNLAGAFELGQPLLKTPPRKAVLLLDDIYTTGATARAAAHTLRRHQISVYGMVAVARTQVMISSAF
jgi:ComF family protein